MGGVSELGKILLIDFFLIVFIPLFYTYKEQQQACSLLETTVWPPGPCSSPGERSTPPPKSDTGQYYAARWLIEQFFMVIVRPVPIVFPM